MNNESFLVAVQPVSVLLTELQDRLIKAGYPRATVWSAVRANGSTSTFCEPSPRHTGTSGAFEDVSVFVDRLVDEAAQRIEGARAAAMARLPDAALSVEDAEAIVAMLGPTPEVEAELPSEPSAVAA
jgi:hypothetical protein